MSCSSWREHKEKYGTASDHIFFRCRQVPFRTGTWILDPLDNKIFRRKRVSFVPRFYLRQICTFAVGGSLPIIVPSIRTVLTLFRSSLIRELDFCSGLDVAAVGWWWWVCGNTVHGTRTSHNAVIWTKRIPRISTSKNVLMGMQSTFMFFQHCANVRLEQHWQRAKQQHVMYCVCGSASLDWPLVVRQCSTFHQEVAYFCDTTAGFHTLSYVTLSLFLPASHPTLHTFTVRCKSKNLFHRKLLLIFV